VCFCCLYPIHALTLQPLPQFSYLAIGRVSVNFCYKKRYGNAGDGSAVVSCACPVNSNLWQTPARLDAHSIHWDRRETKEKHCLVVSRGGSGIPRRRHPSDDINATRTKNVLPVENDVSKRKYDFDDHTGESEHCLRIFCCLTNVMSPGGASVRPEKSATSRHRALGHNPNQPNGGTYHT
jgi:hypothetical protein